MYRRIARKMRWRHITTSYYYIISIMNLYLSSSEAERSKIRDLNEIIFRVLRKIQQILPVDRQICRQILHVLKNWAYAAGFKHNHVHREKKTQQVPRRASSFSAWPRREVQIMHLHHPSRSQTISCLRVCLCASWCDDTKVFCRYFRRSQYSSFNLFN